LSVLGVRTVLLVPALHISTSRLPLIVPSLHLGPMTVV
jgi:hypothetical protein